MTNFNFKDIDNQWIKETFQEAKRKGIEETIEDVQRQVSALYREVLDLEEQEKKKMHMGYLSMLENINKYVDCTTCDIKNYKNMETLEYNKHTVYQPRRKVGNHMKIMSISGYPLFELKQIASYGQELIKFPSWKIFFCLLGSIYALSFGAFNVLHWAILLFSFLHSILRVKTDDEVYPSIYIKLNQNLGKFFIPYFWLAVSNVLSNFITINTLAEGSFLAICQSSIVYIELRGIVEKAKGLGWAVPSFLEKLTQNNNRDIPWS